MTAPRGVSYEIDIEQVEWLGRLGRGRHGDAWFVRVGAADVCIAKRVLCVGPEAQRQLTRRLRRIARCSDDSLVHVVAVAIDGDAVVLVRALDPGLSLGRLAAVGSLASGQVAALAEGILGGLGALHSRGLVHGAIHSGNVLVDADGRVRLCDAGLAPRRSVPPTQRQSDLDAMAVLLLEVWRRSRLAANPQLAAILEHSGLARAVDAAGALVALHDVWPESDRMAGRDGLGEFARRLAGEGPPSPPQSSVVAPHRAMLPIPDMPNEPAEPSPDLPSLPLRTRTPANSRWLGAAAAVVAALAIGTSVAVLIHHAPAAAPKAGSGRTARLPPARVSPQPAKLPTAHAAPGAAVLEPPAPRALGYLENAVLTLSPSGCGPGSTCTLMSRIDLGPHPQGTVTWQVVAIDRCSGAESVLASASGVDAVNDQYMWQDVTATLPRRDPLALYVVSLSPVRVASSAVDDPAGATACAGTHP